MTLRRIASRLTFRPATRVCSRTVFNEPVMVDRSPGPNAAYLARLTRALDRMPRQRRNLFLLVRIDGLSYREAGAIHRISEARARRMISRAMLDLRRATRPQDFSLWQRQWPR